jgi:hypothetical protein
MSQSQNEYWQSDKAGLNYCTKHKQYFKDSFGCPGCLVDNVELATRTNTLNTNGKTMTKCPFCKKMTRFRNEHNNAYECLNKRCLMYHST